MNLAIFCDQCSYQVTPTAPEATPSFLQRSSKVGLPEKVSSEEIDSEQARRGEQKSPSLLQRYIPREFMAKLESARASGTMAGERRVVTMLFCDVKGSTAAAEQLDPEEWTEIINGAFEYMIKPVYHYEGTVARLMGDAILAFFGAPITHEDDPQRAVLAGLDITAGIAPYREQIGEQWAIDIDVRVGINTGLVVVGAVGSDLRMEYTAMGDAINLASRMEQTAEPGTVQIAHDTYKIVKPLFDFEELGGLAIKGKEEAVPAYRVLGRKAIAGRQRGIEGLQTVMVGRDRELGSLQEILDRAQQGVGHIVSIIGEAGLGKSRLVREAKQSLLDGTDVEFFETASLSYETTQPYGLFQRLIRKLFDIGPADTGQIVQDKLAAIANNLDEQDQKRVMPVMEALFNITSDDKQVRLEGEAFQRELFQVMPLLWQQRFGQRPTVLVFDDIHWSDPASIELLMQLFFLTVENPLVLLCSYRPDRTEPVWRLRSMADETYHHRNTEIMLRPLTTDQVNELVGNLLSIAELPDAIYQRIQERAGGNPFFVEEVVRSLIDSGAVVSEERIGNRQSHTYWRASSDARQIDIPDSLQSLLAARIDRLEEETRQILQMASVIGRSFYQRVLLTIGGQNNGAGEGIERGIDHLLQLKMIREAARMPELEYKFSNPLTQEVAYQTILLKQRRFFHRQVAEAIQTLFPEQLAELSFQLAFHYRESGEFAIAIKYFAMAGETAFRLYANNEAVAHYDQALALLPKADVSSELLREVYANRGRALELITDYDAAVENYVAMELEGERRDDDMLRLGALIGKTIIHSTFTPVFDPDIGFPLADKALELADHLDEHAVKAEVLWSLMLVHGYVMGDSEQAIHYGEQALELSRTWQLEARLPYVLNDLGRIKGFYGDAEGISLMAEARPLFEAQNNQPLIADNSNGYSLLLLFAGELDEALSYATDGMELSRSLNSAKGVRDNVGRVNNLLLEKGEIGQAIAAIENQLVQLYEHDDVVHFGLPILAIGYAALGQTSSILERYAAERDRAGNLGPVFHDYFLAHLANLYVLNNQYEQAVELLAKCAYDVYTAPFVPYYVCMYLAEAQIRCARSEYAQSIALLERAIVSQTDGGLNYFLGDLLLQQAQVYLAMDPPQQEQARRVLGQAKAALEGAGIKRVLWRILAALAELAAEEEAAQLRQASWQLVSEIAERIEEDDLRRAFLEHPDVRSVKVS